MLFSDIIMFKFNSLYEMLILYDWIGFHININLILFKILLFTIQLLYSSYSFFIYYVCYIIINGESALKFNCELLCDEIDISLFNVSIKYDVLFIGII